MIGETIEELREQFPRIFKNSRFGKGIPPTKYMSCFKVGAGKLWGLLNKVWGVKIPHALKNRTALSRGLKASYGEVFYDGDWKIVVSQCGGRFSPVPIFWTVVYQSKTETWFSLHTNAPEQLALVE